MAQSLSRILIHLIFSTRERHPFLDDQIRPRMHAYLATLCRDCDADAYRVGGVADHVHIACRLPRTLAVSQLVEKIKKDSSKWIKTQGDAYPEFHWQAGYGAFSVGSSQLEKLIAYVDRQEDHHRQETFQEEYRRFLAKYQVEYDERYVWD